MGCLYQMGYKPFRSFYAGILRDTLHQETGPTATRKVVLRIIGRRGLFDGDGWNKVNVSLFLAMLEIYTGDAGLDLFSFQRSSGCVGSRNRKTSTIVCGWPACLAVRDSRQAILAVSLSMLFDKIVR
jgi:hypothetical protein